jgi:hypothetical protein
VALRVAFRGRKYPYTDDWALVPFLTGQEPVTLGWLWAETGNHRIPLVKVAFVALYNRFTTYDFRLGVVVNVLALAALAGGLMLMARRLRGSTAYSDAFFPLTILQWGLAATWWNFGLHYVCWLLVATAFLAIILRHERGMSDGYALLSAASVVLLPLCGTIGLVLVPALAVWLLIVGCLEWRAENGNRRAALVAALGAGGSLTIALISLVGLTTGSVYRGVDPSAILTVSVIFLSGEFGRAFSGFRLAPWPFFMPCLALASAVALIRAIQSREVERRRGSGLLLFLAAMVCLALAVGFGRGGRDWQTPGVRDHYAILAVPLLIWAHFVWILYYGSRPVGRFVQMSLLALVGVVFVLNLGSREYVARIREWEERFDEDARAGVSASALAERYRELFWWQDTDVGRLRVAEGLRTLRRAGVSPFRRARGWPRHPASDCRRSRPRGCGTRVPPRTRHGHW